MCLSEGNDASQNDELIIHSEEDEPNGSDAVNGGAQDDLESERNGREQDKFQNGEDEPYGTDAGEK